VRARLLLLHRSSPNFRLVVDSCAIVRARVLALRQRGRVHVFIVLPSLVMFVDQID